jgi:hypothetical protein
MTKLSKLDLTVHVLSLLIALSVVAVAIVGGLRMAGRL